MREGGREEENKSSEECPQLDKNPQQHINCTHNQYTSYTYCTLYSYAYICMYSDWRVYEN